MNCFQVGRGGEGERRKERGRGKIGETKYTVNFHLFTCQWGLLFVIQSKDVYINTLTQTENID